MSSSLVPITVEHPQYMQTFVVRVSPAATVNDIKHEISRECPGHPSVDGQRLISKGRVLDDAERIELLWMTSEDARVVHLAVNPLSWSSDPPKVPLTNEYDPPSVDVLEEFFRTETQPLSPEVPVADIDIPTTPPPSLPHFQTLPFISYMHHRALQVLSTSTPPFAPGADGSPSAKEYAKAALQAADHPWPEIFDAEFPSPTDGGVAYEFTLVCGKPFLENLTLYATPTPLQKHALDVLSYTFPLLTLSFPPPNVVITNANITPPPQAHIVPNVNAAAAGRADPNARNVVAVRINMRELITPLFLLFLRTLILLYFFSPARKPVFGILLGAYILYEAWGAVRGAVFDVGPLNGNNGAAGRPNEQRRRPGEPNGAVPAPPPQNGTPPLQNPGAIAAANLRASLERLAQLPLERENRWLENGAPEPSFLYKLTNFLFLLLLSVHPGLWNRRRAALRTREGRLRTEANALETGITQQADGDEGGDERARQARQQLIERHETRPAWIREYIDRVRRGDWVDD